MAATLTINYKYPVGLNGDPIVNIGTRTFALNAGNTFTIPDRTGSPGTAFSPAAPANSGLDFTGWSTYTGSVYPITPSGAGAYWNNGIPGTTASADAIAAANGGGAFPTLTSVTLNVTAYYSTPVICFKEDSEILTYDESADKESYVKVQDLRKGMLVKTLCSGYVPVKLATSSKIYNSGNSHRSESRLYRCPKSAFPELKEDLIITGHHSILVDNLTEDQINEIQDTYGRVYITEKKYRLPAFVDERTVPYEEEGTFNIYHFALENNNVKANYGVYANGGLVVESANEWRLREKSGHTIISE
jgi:hypothetical protein